MIEYWKSQLPESFKKQYDIMLKAIKQQVGAVQLAVSQNMVNDIAKIYEYILADHPELYYASPQISVAMSSRSFAVNLSYLYDAKQKRAIEQSFADLRCELKKELNKSEIEKVYSAVYLLMKNSKYEINNLYNQNAAAAIHYHTAQCSGFASAFKYAMDYLGVWSIVVSGSVSSAMQSGPHAWNVVKLKGLYYHIDITSFAGKGLNAADQLARYTLFESDLQKKQQGYIWNASAIPPCDEMTVRTQQKPRASSENITDLSKESIADKEENLPIFTRLFDVQSQIRECIKNRITYYEFLLKIPMYSNEKLMRIILNDALEQGKMMAASFEVQIGCLNNKIYIKFKFNN